MTTIKQIIKDLDIDEYLTAPIRKEKVFTTVKSQIPLIEDYNFMADLLYLPDDNGFKYCLVVVDLASDEFDIEQIKDKESSTILKALKTMFERDFIKKPYASIKTDSGSEFKGIFHKYLYDESIYHSIALTGRHKQMSNVESLNKQLGRIFNGYMNMMELRTHKAYTNWTKIINFVRKRLNKARKKKLPKYPFKVHMDIFRGPLESTYKVGDIIYRKLETPENALGQKLKGPNFRMGDFRFDTIPRKIKKVLEYSGKIPYRYILDGFENVSYTAKELKKSLEKEEEWEVRKLIGKKTIKGKIYYLVWWKGYLKKDSTWEPKSELIKTIKDMVNSYHDE
jgi:hypothetical protein